MLDNYVVWGKILVFKYVFIDPAVPILIIFLIFYHGLKIITN